MLFLRLLQHIGAVANLLLVHQGGAHLVALGLQEGVGHAAADDEGVHLAQEVFNDAELIGNLGAPQDGQEGPLGVLHGVAQVLDFLLHQVAHGGFLHVIGDAGGGAVGPVAGAEGVVHVDVAKGGQVLGEVLDVLGLLLAEAGILKKHHVAVLHGGHGGPGVIPYHSVVICEDDGFAQQLGKADGHGSQGELLLRAVLGLAQVGAEDEPGALVHQVLDGGQGGDDAVVVGDFPLLHGDVEIAPHQHPLAGGLQVLDGDFVVGNHGVSSPSFGSGGLPPTLCLLPYFTRFPTRLQGIFHKRKRGAARWVK